jgi:hypothetical protein
MVTSDAPEVLKMSSNLVPSEGFRDLSLEEAKKKNKIERHHILTGLNYFDLVALRTEIDRFLTQSNGDGQRKSNKEQEA